MLLHDKITLGPDMNDRKSSLPDDSGQDEGGGAPVSLSRRRFTRGAAPVVVGSLLSSPVLGAEYICTASGFTSGNMSAHLTDNTDCDIGDDVTFWNTSSTAWPGSFDRGGLPNSGTFPLGQRGTAFNDTAGLAAVFYYQLSDNSITTTATNIPATMRQILATTDAVLLGLDVELFQLGRAVIASILNVAKYPAYPVSQARVVEMFNAVRASGTYPVDGTNLRLTRGGVIDYLESLYS